MKISTKLLALGLSASLLGMATSAIAAPMIENGTTNYVLCPGEGTSNWNSNPVNPKDVSFPDNWQYENANITYNVKEKNNGCYGTKPAEGAANLHWQEGNVTTTVTPASGSKVTITMAPATGCKNQDQSTCYRITVK
ncbi:hypothetical protein BH10PSE19_BH10PSE19_08180 [soil metagenome]